MDYFTVTTLQNQDKFMKLGKGVNTEVKSRPFSVFESKFIGYKQYMGKGLKIFP
jgi:hypothetical protein